MTAPASCDQSSARTHPIVRAARAIATLASAQQALAPSPRRTPAIIAREDTLSVMKQWWIPAALW